MDPVASLAKWVTRDNKPLLILSFLPLFLLFISLSPRPLPRRFQLPPGPAVAFDALRRVLQWNGVELNAAEETITIGPIVVREQATGMIERAVGAVFMSGQFDGIMGLSYQGAEW